MTGALRAEWTKLRTVPGTGWVLAAVAALTAGLGWLVDAVSRCPAGQACGDDPARLALTGVQAGQAAVVMLAAAALTGEYSTGMIRVTLAAMPRRTEVLAAKAILTGGLTLAAAAAGVAGSLLAARLIQPGHGLGTLSLAHGPVLRACAGSVLYLALVDLLTLGAAALIRDSAVTAGVVLALLYLAPLLARLVAASPQWYGRAERYLPMPAGLAIQATTGLRALPITPWAGLGVLAAWAAAALAAGGLSLARRDA